MKFTAPVTVLIAALFVLVSGYYYFHEVRNHQEPALILPSSYVVSSSAPAVSINNDTKILPSPEKGISTTTSKIHIDMKVVLNPTGFNKELLALTNGDRKAPIQESAVLDARAKVRAEYICTIPFTEAAHDSFYIINPNSPSPVTSILSDLSKFTAENLARNFDSVEATNAGFMASVTHRTNIIDTGYQYMGIGHVVCSPNQYGNESVTIEFFTGSPL